MIENLKKNISKNNNFFLLEKNNMISFIKVSKNFETFDGLIAKIYSLENNQKINVSELNCDNINNSENNFSHLKQLLSSLILMLRQLIVTVITNASI